jgi:trans-aconitate methyltransferase
VVERSLPTGTAKVVEIGCGPGRLLSDLAERHPELDFRGLDVEERMISHAREHHAQDNASFEVCDLTVERPSFTADFAYSIDLLHHIREPQAFLEGLHGVLRPRAEWVAIEPNLYHPYIYWSQERMRRAGYDEDHFRPREMEPKLRGAGFYVKTRSYAFLFPGWIDRVPPALARVEPTLERFRVLGGSVVYRLERR